MQPTAARVATHSTVVENDGIAASANNITPGNSPCASASESFRRTPAAFSVPIVDPDTILVEDVIHVEHR